MTVKVFVFGSNLAGIHGAGAARDAVQYHGATYGNGIGFQGNSYAIPTKDKKLKSLSTAQVLHYVNEFIQQAIRHPELTFQVTRIGCGLAGFTDGQIAPMFGNAPMNCEFDTEWKPWLPGKRFWGTY